jgi:hypothetical protein
MKAYMTFSGYPQDGCLLVYAETKNKARYLTVGSEWDWEYDEINAWRKPEFDQYYNGRAIIETNDELPEGAPEFYDDR